MSTQQFNLTADWTDITAAASLVADQVYLIQNTNCDQVYLFEDATPPAATQTGIVLGSNAIIQFEQQTDNLYARASDNHASGITLSESY